jgi:hypothetical protein
VNIKRALIAIWILVASSQIWAYDLSPKGTKFDRAAVQEWAPSLLDRILSTLADKGLEKFKEPVHEEITQRIYGCNYELATICGNPDGEWASPYVIAGLRWNDDPPFQLNDNQARGLPCKIQYKDGRRVTIRFITQPDCWGKLFLAGEKAAKANPSINFSQASQAAMPLRSHLGDMQFVHSMASSDEEDPVETRRKILGWAQFTWGVVRGEHGLGVWLKDIDQPVIQTAFGNTGWRVQDLFALGDETLRGYIGDVAFGSLLHMVQDSFARGHVDRLEPANGSMCPGGKWQMPGPIQEFHSYRGQKSSSHASADERLAFANNRKTPDVVDVGRVLLSLRKSNGQSPAEWSEVEAYLNCVYSFAPTVRGATAGPFK